MIKDKTKTFTTIQSHKSIGKGKLKKSEKAVIEYSATLDLTGNITIGDYTKISHGVVIFTHNHKWNHSRKRRSEIQKIEVTNLEIGEDVFIGINALIIGVEKIGDVAIIGAGAVVTKNVPAYEIWAGNPARKVGERKED